MTLANLAYVAAGGALGAVARFGVVSLVGILFGHGFPYGTIVVNVLGSFVLGSLIEFSALVWTLTPELRVFLVVGVLGAFTTFSAFSLDAVTLLQRGAPLQMIGYVVVSVSISILAFWAGLRLTRMVFS